MKHNRLLRLVAVLLVGTGGVALAHAAPLRTSQPTTATVYDVTAGYGDDDYAANAFTPTTLHIYVGDTVRWHVGGTLEPHLVAFGPPSELADLAAHLTVVISRTAGPPLVEINPRLALPTRQATYDGRGLVTSGFLPPRGAGPPRSWSLTFTQPGTYSYVCLLHYNPAAPAASMGGTVVVLPRPAPTHIYHVTTGYDDGTMRQAVDAFFPDHLTVHVGDTVTWSPGFHSVAFGPPALLARLRRAFVTPLAQHAGPPALTLNAQVVFPSGGPTYDGVGLASSGLLVMPAPHPWALTFTKAGVYRYACLIHPGMDGVITVLPSGQ